MWIKLMGRIGGMGSVLGRSVGSGSTSSRSRKSCVSASLTSPSNILDDEAQPQLDAAESEPESDFVLPVSTQLRTQYIVGDGEGAAGKTVVLVSVSRSFIFSLQCELYAAAIHKKKHQVDSMKSKSRNCSINTKYHDESECRWLQAASRSSTSVCFS
jgi:hypothetical protein